MARPTARSCLTPLLVGAGLLAWAGPIFSEPRIMGPIVRSEDRLTLTATIRDYGGEIRVRAQVWTPKPNGTIVGLPLCQVGIPDTTCSWDAPEWLVDVSVDGGLSWVPEALPEPPGGSTTLVSVDTAGVPILVWKLEMTPAVSRWEFQRAVPTYDRWAWDGLTWVDYDAAPEWLYCSTWNTPAGARYLCRRPMPTVAGDDAGQYLYRVRGCNFAGCGAWGEEQYAVCMPLLPGIPGPGGAPCFWPDNGACIP